MGKEPGQGRELPGYLEEIYRSGMVYDADGNALQLEAAVNSNEARLLYETVRTLKPDSCLEVGLGQGVSAASILLGLEGNRKGRLVTVDPWQHSFRDVGLETVKRSGSEGRHTFYREYLEDVFSEIPKIDFAFIDASHLFDLTLAAFAMVDRRLRSRGVVGFHDMWLPSQQKVVRYILSNRHYELYPEPCPLPAQRLGLAARWLKPEVTLPWTHMRIPNLVLLRKTAADDRQWNYHEEF